MFEHVNPGLSFVIPAYNEEGAIVSTVERLRGILASLDIPSEIIVVNDGSKDNTGERVRSCAGIRAVSHPINTGYGSAIKTGILCARYSWIGIVDADGTYDIELIPELVERMKKGFDMVVAARRNVLELDGPFKRFFRKSLIRFLNLIIGGRIEDPNSGLRIFHRDVAMSFFPFLCNTFSFTTSITIFALGEGYFVNYVPMNYSKREGKSKVRHFRDSLRMMQLILQGITFFNPVKLSIMLILALLGLGAVPAFILALLGMPTVATYHLAISIASVLLFALGVLGDIIRITSTSRINKKSSLVAEANITEEDCAV
ncbi:glycosyltransferase family 2 protein [Magnetospirillum gryphiswaldense]|uniref:Glycosyl transferase, family 2 n=1 Tax=Magnetospirillum gryphiswaldense TaxID=55518 RepID=A4U188_9PROT|nr:glycosyltransferase family 2 protein [Magnetospirillum gryphiswaldense]AVM75574.1 Undecaprenyl-phosphate 4-deoxy-4-formamido-L-arabinose transferase [Magnetospirillum gryphiswaldense MSR-1]AVM79477.1 Undecaprenyl-phosphate 4-deoxy-4-formamido-L-arabinose transferase [Magnetospirillum gryphiswaldense]CAM76645.1 Glycosyl transferase, family 2 [Magnetospirillum gryphiswaldense MSR-1]